MAERAPVTFVPAGLTVWVPAGTTVLEAARLASVLVPAPCGGRGVCGSCAVHVVAGRLAAPDDEERRGLARAPEGVRLACRAQVECAVSVRPMVLSAQPSASASGATADRSIVAGVDLGTTSVAAVLVESESGRELARSVVANKQQSFGADVVSRIGAAREGSGAELSALAEESVVDALSTAAAAANGEVGSIGSLVIAANGAMATLLVDADVSSLAAAPFTSPKYDRVLPASSVTRAIAPNAKAIILPPIAGFVGGDALAAAMSAGLYAADGPTLLVDIGTNAEVVLAGAGPLWVASAAAGPAFEGGGVSCGGPAVDGAVERVRITAEGTVLLSVLGKAEPAWLSGSGLVSALAELRRTGHLDAEGLLHADGPLRSRFRTSDAGVAEVSFGDGECLTVSQLDIRSLQLAKAAVRVAVDAVLRRAGVDAVSVVEWRVAGAFGGALDPGDLVALGVLPRESASHILLVGNAALEGAAMVALDADLLGRGEELAAGAVHVDLVGDPAFASELMRATRLERS